MTWCINDGSEGLKRLLQELDKRDITGSHHTIPMESYSNEEKYLNNLREIYSQDFLAYTREYACTGDSITVTKKTETYYLKIKSGSQGIVKRKRKGGLVLVEFEPLMASFWYAPHWIYVIGRKGGLFREEKVYPETRGDLLRIKKHDIVRTKEELPYYLHYYLGHVQLNPGTQGRFKERIIVGMHKRCYLAEFSFPDMVIEAAVNSKNTIVKKENKIDFEKLCRKCYGGENV